MPSYAEAVSRDDVNRGQDDCSAGIEKAAPKSRLQVALKLLGFLGRLALAGFVRCRVVDLADVVGLDRKRLVLYAVMGASSLGGCLCRCL